ncbi:hypothetical protein [Qipengyuania atrilutea]|uniref:Prevent-host-death protein n=1 Tax=Qipengyuania atrilutea TaxID=2744473 RepID=A0A850GZK6_9SPHN|nr:hypothetical protein [Actirhodobacter atriluteus]NVD45094.1 hypothetical protein [Actirhodobacter atriluteus]
MRPHACFRISVDELKQDVGKYLELAKTRTFEIFHNGEVDVMLVRVSAIPDWDARLQKSVRTDLLTVEEWETFMKPPEDLSHLPDSYDDWTGEAD